MLTTVSGYLGLAKPDSLSLRTPQLGGLALQKKEKTIKVAKFQENEKEQLLGSPLLPPKV